MFWIVRLPWTRLLLHESQQRQAENHEQRRTCVRHQASNQIFASASEAK